VISPGHRNYRYCSSRLTSDRLLPESYGLFSAAVR
jgi:hypothetical protein